MNEEEVMHKNRLIDTENELSRLKLSMGNCDHSISTLAKDFGDEKGSVEALEQ